MDGGVPPVGERKKCPCGRNDVNYPPPEEYWRYVDLDQGSFVSSILWSILTGFYVTGDLKDALQKEGFEGIEFDPEPVEIVEDNRKWRDRKKLPLDQIPPFYRVKLLTSIPIHQRDVIDRYDVKPCPDCGRILTNHLDMPIILDGKHHPGTDFFGVRWSAGRYGAHRLCTERGKAFLEAYPDTHCRFEEYELRD